MLNLPRLPLDIDSRNLIDFCLEFRTVAGFVKVFEENYSLLKIDHRKKRGLKTAAYEVTEQLYVDLLNIGRRFPDRDNFFDAYSKLKRGRKK